jgi:hypothetical protein
MLAIQCLLSDRSTQTRWQIGFVGKSDRMVASFCRLTEAGRSEPDGNRLRSTLSRWSDITAMIASAV